MSKKKNKVSAAQYSRVRVPFHISARGKVEVQKWLLEVQFIQNATPVNVTCYYPPLYSSTYQAIQVHCLNGCGAIPTITRQWISAVKLKYNTIGTVLF